MKTRLMALRLLMEVLHRKKSLRQLMPEYTAELSDIDRSFLQELVYGVLRNLYYLDYRINFYLHSPRKLSQYTLMNLRLGAYQILFMKVPDWASVNETVDVEKRTGRNPGVVNAVLRRFVTEKQTPPLPQDPVKRLSVLTSHPQWIVKRWIKRYGLKEAEALMFANNKIPPITLRVNLLASSRQQVLNRLKEHNIQCTETPYSPVGIKLTQRCSRDFLSSLMPSAMVQDEAAQLVTMLLAPSKGQRILDACAAPGGKTAFIVELVGREATVVAVDVSHERAMILKNNLTAMGHSEVDIIEADIRDVSFSLPFDRIIVDAPCSSLGVIRRNPDVRYRYTPEDLRQFRELQIEILSAACRFLAPNGILLYSVCTLEPEETTEVVREFLQKNKNFIIIKDIPSEMFRPFIDEKGFFVTLPHRDDMDGHFAVRFTRQ